MSSDTEGQMKSYILKFMYIFVKGWVSWEGYEYFISSGTASPPDARSFCRESNADLVSILSRDENRFIESKTNTRYDNGYDILKYNANF